MRLKSLTYTSVARPDLQPADIAAIHHVSLDLNALEGITGILIYNGERFLQVIEGARNAIDDLLRRLLADDRHSQVKVEDERHIAEREFADWTMKLAQVSISYLEAQKDIVRELPGALPNSVRSRVLELTAGISRRT